jgi:acyl dehydratase
VVAVAVTVCEGVEGLRKLVGTHLGHSAWLEVDQARIDAFAGATDDHQWIHVDPERAADGPFGATIAHGYLTLSLVNRFLPEVVLVRGFAMGVNYGADRVRFPAPVPVGSRLRGGVELAALDDVAGGVQATWLVTVEVEGGAKPACVVSSLARYLD